MLNRDLAEGDRALSARFSSPVGKQVYGGWVFFAPADTTIASLTVWRAVRVSTNYGVGWWILGTDASAAQPGPGLEGRLNYEINHCTELGSLIDATSPSNRADFSGLHVSEVDARLLCAGLNPGLPCDTPAEFRLYRARIALLDAIPPVVGEVAGDLDGSAPLQGSHTLRFAASDRGGGIATVGLIVDGVEHSAKPAAPLEQSCRQPYTCASRVRAPSTRPSHWTRRPSPTELTRWRFSRPT